MGRVMILTSKDLAEMNAARYYEYNEAETMEQFREEGREEGRREGREEGLRALVRSLKDFLPDFESVYTAVVKNVVYADVSREQARKYY